MNPVDLIALILVVFALIVGFRSGALPQMFGLGGALLGVVAAVAAVIVLRDWLNGMAPLQRAGLSLAIVFVGMALGEMTGSTVGGLARRRLGVGVLESIDSLAGGVLGAAQALVMVWLLGGLLAMSSLPSFNIAAEQSFTLRTLSGVLPPPATFSSDLQRLLNASGLPDIFVGLEPPPAPAVPGPAQARADAIASAAEASTVEVEAEACGYSLTGTGFAIAPGYVVTNAHVIAGQRFVIVRGTGDTLQATPVLFDPALDVAVLHVPGYDATPLRFSSATPSRATIGAALGHPAGGPLAVVPAAVTSSYTAEGRDLYSTHFVTRQIVELQARIERGDSGGPFVLADGTVGGIVFAASRVSPNVGYALAPGPVAAEVMPAVGLKAAVSTGGCIS